MPLTKTDRETRVEVTGVGARGGGRKGEVRWVTGRKRRLCKVRVPVESRYCRR